MLGNCITEEQLFSEIGLTNPSPLNTLYNLFFPACSSSALHVATLLNLILQPTDELSR